MSFKEEDRVEIYVEEAEKRLAEGSVIEAIHYVVAAREWKPADPRVCALEARVTAILTEKVESSPQVMVFEARDLWRDEKNDEAKALLTKVLRDTPGFRPAEVLLHKIRKEELVH